MSIGFFVVTLVYAAILIYVATRLSKMGSDNHFYDFYIQAIRNNGHRMIKSFDRFLNYAEPTDPQFFFWLLSWFPDSAIKYVTVLLNSTLSVILGVSFYMFLRSTSLSAYAEVVYMAFIFTPVYFFGSNSRLTGLSARGFGLLLFFLLSWSVYQLELNGFDIRWFVAAVTFGFLIWGSSLFAQQAFVGFALFLMVQGYFWMTVVLLSSTFIFLAVCRGYAVRFFKNRYRYLLIYKNVLASKLLLQNRPSVWGDFLKGFWKRGNRSQGSHVHYVLANPVIQALVYLPLLPVILFERSTTGDSFFTSLILSAVQVRILFAFAGAGILCFLITSFRGTRFLGEPERYLEIINPFIVMLGISILFKWDGNKAVIGYTILVSVFAISQILLYVKAITPAQNRISSDIKSIVHAIQQHASGEEVRLFSNNQDWMKFYLPHNFNIVYYYPTQERIAGIHLDEIMPKFSIIDENYIDRVIAHYNINYCLLDKKYVSNPISGKDAIIYQDQTSILLYRTRMLEVKN